MRQSIFSRFAILPELNGDYPLLPEQIETFQQMGHLRLDSIMTIDEIAAYRPGLVAAVNRYDLERKAMEKSVAGQSQGWKFVENLWQLDATARQFVLAKRFGKIAADLLGVDTVRLFRDQSYFKDPGGGNTPWHQDGYFMPLDTQKIVTMWIAISDVSADMAPMTFVTGSHLQGYMGTSMPMDASLNEFEHAIAQRGFQFCNYGAMAAGDASFHWGWTLHSSRQNTDHSTREAFVVVYYADGARVSMPPVSSNALPQEHFAAVIRQHNLNTCLPGLQSGDLAVTDMNPIVYQRS
ncbi:MULTISPECIES: phytanoyl-CoA dioxygenase family protein [Leptolyngbya]|uniref:phytanoyl-CoA dioxygenase family protein n=1 Tax=Leptolyngbya TaxID=47251 RepID=UPI00168240C4|nr:MULTISPECIES: phytanoyl-CoA dioxygenase family protein [unclassified Leptolyngbya]MBD1856116.1 phytanoyl-CoA dioxygenase family protein [Leptolyngbya sp. FACHB-1624]MCY6490345.1 phytanoyl-CoA dioxygenase family protein [Leptolyngbya sp. GGD]